MYDAFNHLTSQTGKHWSSPDILSSTNTFTNNRRNNAAYDADGNLLSGNFPDTYSYNSAGQISAVQAVNDNTTQVFDGDGLRVKTTETTQSNGQSSTDVTYYITSSVLGGRVLTEMNQNGGKRRTFVSAGEQVLAWQMIVLGTERVMWEHRDPNSASFRTTNQNASVNDQTYVGDGAPAELDPLGADTGLVDPYWYSPPPEENLDSLVSYPSFGGAGSFGTTYSWDGIRMPANEFFEMVNMVLHGRFGIGQALMRGTRVSGTRTISDRWRVQPHVRQPDDTGDVVRVNAVAPHFIYTTLSSDITPLYGTDASGVELLSTLQQNPQPGKASTFKKNTPAPNASTDPCAGKKKELIYTDKALKHIDDRHIRVDINKDASKYNMGSFRIWSVTETTKWFTVDGYNQATYQNAKGYQSGKNIVFIYAAPGIHVPGVGDVFVAIGRDASQGHAVTNVNTLVTEADCRTVVTSHPGLPKGILPGDPRITGTPMSGMYVIPKY